MIWVECKERSVSQSEKRFRERVKVIWKEQESVKKRIVPWIEWEVSKGVRVESVCECGMPRMYVVNNKEEN